MYQYIPSIQSRLPTWTFSNTPWFVAVVFQHPLNGALGHLRDSRYLCSPHSCLTHTPNHINSILRASATSRHVEKVDMLSMEMVGGGEDDDTRASHDHPLDVTAPHCL